MQASSGPQNLTSGRCSWMAQKKLSAVVGMAACDHTCRGIALSRDVCTQATGLSLRHVGPAAYQSLVIPLPPPCSYVTVLEVMINYEYSDLLPAHVPGLLPRCCIFCSSLPPGLAPLHLNLDSHLAHVYPPKVQLPNIYPSAMLPIWFTVFLEPRVTCKSSLKNCSVVPLLCSQGLLSPRMGGP